MTISCKRDAPCEPGAGRPSIGVRACLLRATRAPDRLEVMASSPVPGGPDRPRFPPKRALGTEAVRNVPGRPTWRVRSWSGEAGAHRAVDARRTRPAGPDRAGAMRAEVRAW